MSQGVITALRAIPLGSGNSVGKCEKPTDESPGMPRKRTQMIQAHMPI
jgi:hypothetical protein